MQQIVDAVEELRGGRLPVIVGISGFAGSGKSTLARALVTVIERSTRIRGDDFLDPSLSHRRSTDWAGVERLRLRSEVLEPLRAGRTGQFQRFDWSRRQLGMPESLPQADIVIVDAIGLFHPELEGIFDLAIWVDADLDVATGRGKSRDRSSGRDHDRLWDEVWISNERDFAARFDPRGRADMVFDAR